MADVFENDETLDAEIRGLHDVDTGELREGATLGRYVLVRALGRGGMGEVWIAHDPELSRNVAMKLLHADPRDETEQLRAQTRMRREAQALAQLSHPNIVAVHDVGLVHGRVFVAMELVRGRTLRAWLDAGPHDWREVVRVLVEAGRGLAAAHEIGLVHRDFKPDNVMIDDRDRVRVLDFGLAIAEPGKPRSRAETASLERSGSGPDMLDTPLTRAGALVGTPAYMPPEQLRGERSGPAADQFSFCVVLFEALHGIRPFAASSLYELLDAIERGPSTTAVPTTRRIPARLRSAITRGLASAPEQRFASLDALLEELTTVARPRPRRHAAQWVTAAFVVTGIGTAWAWSIGKRDRCDDPPTQLGGAWTDEAATAIADNLAAAPQAYVTDSAERVVADLGRYADAWVALDRGACLADDGVPEALRRAQASCLVGRRRALAAVTFALANGETRGVLHAVELVGGLPQLAVCSDASWLAATVAPPDDPEMQAAVDDLSDGLARASVLEHGGAYDEALALTDMLSARAGAIGYPPLAAEVAYLRARVLSKRGELDPSEEAFTTAFDLALTAGADRLAGNIASHLVYVVGYQKRRHDEGLVWGRQAQAMLERVGGGPDERATLRDHLGVVTAAKGDDRGAVADFEQAIALWEDAPDRGRGELATVLGHLGIVQRKLGELAAAEATIRRALEIEIAELGPRHPDVGTTRSALASVLQQQGRHDEARAAFVEAIAIQAAGLGNDHPDVAATVMNLGNLERRVGDYAAARVAYERALDIRERAFAPGHPDIAITHHNLGSVFSQLGDPAEALARTQIALDMRLVALGEEHNDVASSRLAMADLLLDRGRVREAIDHTERAIAIYERTYGPEHVRTANARANLGHAYWKAGRTAEARDMQEAALAATIAAGGEDGPEVPDRQIPLALVHAELAERDDRGSRAELDDAMVLMDRAVAAKTATLGIDNPRTLDARLWQAWVRRSREPKLALTQAHEVIALHERDPESTPELMRASWVLLADVMLAAGAHDEARARYERILEIPGDDADTITAHLALAELAWRRRARPEASRHVAQARALLPREPGRDVARVDAWVAAHR